MGEIIITKRQLITRKDELMYLIKQELSKVSKTKANEIRERLWKELGVMV